MASYTGIVRAKHATLVANTVDTLTFTADLNSIEVLNRGTSGDIYVSVDGTTDPTVGGDFYIVPAGGALQLDVPTSGATVIKLICASANAYSVTGGF